MRSQKVYKCAKYKLSFGGVTKKPCVHKPKSLRYKESHFCKSDDAWMKKGRGAEEKIAKIGRM
jgi:hypothetical protein